MPTRRCIRSFERVAERYHDCMRCEISIFPGDPYVGRVYVCGRRLWVEKEHFHCPVEPDEEARRAEESSSARHFIFR